MLIAVLIMVHLKPHVSLRQIECKLGVPRLITHRILWSINYHPYHITLIQELSENDCSWESIFADGPWMY